MELLAIILLALIFAIMFMAVMIVAVELDMAKKWGNIFKGKGRD